MSRQEAFLYALGMVAAAAGLLSVGTFVLLWRELRARRRSRADPDDPGSPDHPAHTA